MDLVVINNAMMSEEPGTDLAVNHTENLNLIVPTPEEEYNWLLEEIILRINDLDGDERMRYNRILGPLLVFMRKHEDIEMEKYVGVMKIIQVALVMRSQNFKVKVQLRVLEKYMKALSTKSFAEKSMNRLTMGILNKDLLGFIRKQDAAVAKQLELEQKSQRELELQQQKLLWIEQKRIAEQARLAQEEQIRINNELLAQELFRQKTEMTQSQHNFGDRSFKWKK